MGEGRRQKLWYTPGRGEGSAGEIFFAKREFESMSSPPWEGCPEGGVGQASDKN
jgi:hypothetical protein